MNTTTKQTHWQRTFGIVVLSAFVACGLSDPVEADKDRPAANGAPVSDGTTSPDEVDGNSAKKGSSAKKAAEDADLLRPHIIAAEHVLLWDGEIVTWEEVVGRLRTLRPLGPLHPTFHSTNGLHRKEERGWQYYHDEIMDLYRELFEPAGVTFSSVSPRGSRRLDKIRTAKDLRPDPSLARTGRVTTPDGWGAQNAQVVVLPVEDIVGVPLRGKQLRDPINEDWVRSDESGRFTIHPTEETYVLAILHESGVAVRTVEADARDLFIRLEPWATVTFTSTPNLEGQSAALAIRPGHLPPQSSEFLIYEIDARSKPVSVPVPAGRVVVRRSLEMEDGTSIGLPADRFPIAAGEERKIELAPATLEEERRAMEIHNRGRRLRGSP